MPYRRHSGLKRFLLASLVVVLVLVLAAAGLAVRRVLTKKIPPYRSQVVLASSIRFPGPAPKPAWPSSGEAALAVLGAGSLGTHGPTTPVPVASLAKLMTAYLVLKADPLAVGAKGFTVSITYADAHTDDQLVAAGDSTVPVNVGETLDEYQLLQGLLVPSGDNIAILLADQVAGSVPAFVARMNAEAKALGMDHTTYTDPSGVNASTVSTAADELRLAEVTMQVPVIARIADESSVDLPVAGVEKNYDTLIGQDGFVGLKTGSDSKAGGCLAFVDDRVVLGRHFTVVGVVLGQDVGRMSVYTLVGAATAAASALAASATTGLKMRTVLAEGSTVETVTDAAGDRVTATTTSALTAMGWGGMSFPVRISGTPPRTRLVAGEQIATVSVSGPLDGASSPVRATADMPTLGLLWKAQHAF